MKPIYILIAGLAGWLVPDPAPARQDNAPPAGVEVLTRGPVHEAYAEPVEPKPVPTPVERQQPPAPVPETPPDVRPEGDNVVWIPGYWSWDDGSQGYIWVSGFWREAPVGRRWVSGYWQQVQNGWQWVPGFWGAENIDQVDYLPAPPDPVPESPPPAPADASVLVPGMWMWQNNNYYWRPGFYVGYQPDWTYIPPSYSYTPYGYVFVNGYWDHPLDRRGVLFAPVRFARDVMLAATWSYSPSFVVYPDALMTALFVRPNAYSYYYGDYFGANYVNQGFIPWVDYRVGRTAFDPNFAYYSNRFRNDPGWVQGMRDLYAGRQQGTFPRPPRTFAEQGRVAATINGQNAALLRSLHINNPRDLLQVAAPVGQMHNLRANLVAEAGVRTGQGAAAANIGIRMQHLTPDQHAQVAQSIRQTREVQQRRQQSESRLGAAGRPEEAGRQPRTARLDLPRTVTAARPNEQGQPPRTARTPPPTPRIPQAQERPATPNRPVAPRPEPTPRPVPPERPVNPRPEPTHRTEPRPVPPERPVNHRPEPTPRPAPPPERPVNPRPEPIPRPEPRPAPPPERPVTPRPEPTPRPAPPAERPEPPRPPQRPEPKPPV